MKGVQTELVEELTKAATADPSLATDDQKWLKNNGNLYESCSKCRCSI